MSLPVTQRAGHRVDMATARRCAETFDGGAGYRLVQRKPRRRMGVAELAVWREKCLAEYHRLREQTPDLTLTAACALITKKYRRRLYWTTLADCLAPTRDAAGAGINHFADCPNRDQHRLGKPSALSHPLDQPQPATTTEAA